MYFAYMNLALIHINKDFILLHSCFAKNENLHD